MRSPLVTMIVSEFHVLLHDTPLARMECCMPVKRSKTRGGENALLGIGVKTHVVTLSFHRHRHHHHHAGSKFSSSLIIILLSAMSLEAFVPAFPGVNVPSSLRAS